MLQEPKGKPLGAGQSHIKNKFCYDTVQLCGTYTVFCLNKDVYGAQYHTDFYDMESKIPI